jgi:hypothetical protein
MTTCIIIVKANIPANEETMASVWCGTLRQGVGSPTRLRAEMEIMILCSVWKQTSSVPRNAQPWNYLPMPSSRK